MIKLAFGVDNLLFLINMVIYRLGQKKRKKDFPTEGKEEKATVLALIPIKKEKASVIQDTIDSLIKEVDKIWVLPTEDEETGKEVAKLRQDEKLEIKFYQNKSKAEVLNRAIEKVKTDYVLVIDAGDRINEGFLKNALSQMGEEDEVCLPLQTAEGSFWQRIVGAELTDWTGHVLPGLYNRYRFSPLTGTGLVLRTNFIKKNKFPDTLAEDAALGISAKKIAFSEKSLLYYNLPHLSAHLRQRGRWMAGYLQNLKLSKTWIQRWVFVSPCLQGVVPFSLIFWPITMILGFYHNPLILVVDILAGLNLLVFLFYMMIIFRKPSLILLPFFWFFWGISFYFCLYYLVSGKWYCSPKSKN